MGSKPIVTDIVLWVGSDGLAQGRPRSWSKDNEMAQAIEEGRNA